MKSFGYPRFPSNIPHFMERVNTYCARVLPLVFDNSLSYYEFLGHMQHKLNEVIKALNSQNLVFVEFTHMIELEMQNFEKYVEERQQNFEESMQQEWDAFKTEIRAEWAAFKDEMQQAWADEQALNEQFRTDMQAAFTNFQNVITTQQTAFETAMRNQQNAFQNQMELEQQTFEDDLNASLDTWKNSTIDELDTWKNSTTTALQSALQQFETETMAALENEIQQLVAQNEGAIITAAENAVEGDQINVAGYAVSKYNGSTLVATNLFSTLTAEPISPNTCYVFTSSAAWELINHIMLAKTAPDYPASGWTAHIGVYSSNSPSLTGFNFSEIVETNSAAMQQGSQDLFGGYGGRRTKDYQWFCIWFTSDTSATPFTCNLTDKIFCYGAERADITIQDRSTGSGIKYLIGKTRVMDSTPKEGNADHVVSSAGIASIIEQFIIYGTSPSKTIKAYHSDAFLVVGKVGDYTNFVGILKMPQTSTDNPTWTMLDGSTPSTITVTHDNTTHTATFTTSGGIVGLTIIRCTGSLTP